MYYCAPVSYTHLICKAALPGQSTWWNSRANRPEAEALLDVEKTVIMEIGFVKGRNKWAQNEIIKLKWFNIVTLRIVRVLVR